MLKILQARLQQYMNWGLPSVQAGFRKGRGTRDQTSNIRWIIEKAREYQKNTYFFFTDYAKAFDCGNFFKRWEYQTTWPASWEICMQVKKQQLELDVEQRSGSKLGKEYSKTVYCHPAYLTSTLSTSCKVPSWMKHKLESRLLGKNINNLRYEDDTTFMAESEEEFSSDSETHKIWEALIYTWFSRLKDSGIGEI